MCTLLAERSYASNMTSLLADCWLYAKNKKYHKNLITNSDDNIEQNAGSYCNNTIFEKQTKFICDSQTTMKL